MNDRLTIPAVELSWRFSRSSGPGGQGVNTTDSRVELSWDLAGSEMLPASVRQRAVERLGNRLVNGVLTVTASEHRSQLRNREAAAARLAGIVAGATAPPPRARRLPAGSLPPRRPPSGRRGGRRTTGTARPPRATRGSVAPPAAARIRASTVRARPAPGPRSWPRHDSSGRRRLAVSRLGLAAGFLRGSGFRAAHARRAGGRAGP